MNQISIVFISLIMIFLNMNFISSKLIVFTENILSNIVCILKSKKIKNKKITPFMDWLGAFIWAACVVFVVNQYLFQSYVIPSRSMETSLVIGDRILVNKLIYGPELLPGVLKVKSIFKPNRADVIIFENPEYISRGTVFDIISRLVFMLTLSIVDLDKDINGNPAHHFLIKRLIATGGDSVRIINGNIFVKPNGEGDFLSEENFKKINNINYLDKRTLDLDKYNTIDREIRKSVFNSNTINSSLYYNDLYFSRENNYKYLSNYSPSMLDYYLDYNIKHQGIYIPQNWLLPLGDNRDNSKDGRYFGIINKSEVLGRASFIFWPFTRIGKLK